MLGPTPYGTSREVCGTTISFGMDIRSPAGTLCASITGSAVRSLQSHRGPRIWCEHHTRGSAQVQ